MKPEELLRVFFRYKHVDYDDELFSRTYDWMKSWDLTMGHSEHSGLVAG